MRRCPARRALFMLAVVVSFLPPLSGDAGALAPPVAAASSGSVVHAAVVGQDAAGADGGRLIAPPQLRPEPAATPVRTCSFELPICIHASRTTAPAVILATLQRAEQAMHAFDAIGLARPLADGTRGGGPDYDIYLMEGAELPVTSIDEPEPGAHFDRAAAFSVLPAPASPAGKSGGKRAARPALPPAGCDASARVAHALALASLLRLDAAASTGTLAMTATYLASLAAPCDLVEMAAIDDFQRTPERSITTGDPSRPDGSMLLPWFLDDTFGTGSPAAVILGLFAVTPQHTPAGAPHLCDEPDVFDALRTNLKDRGSSLDALLLDFAVARAFIGSRSDGVHLSDAGRFGHFGRARFEWSIPYASLPRRVAPAHPIEPTGTTYLWVDLSGAPKNAELTFVAEWEAGSVLRWAHVKVDREGAEAGRIETGGIYGSTRAERTLVGLSDLAGVLIVGMHVGSADRSRPFDPDEPARPSGYTITLAR